MKKILLTLLSIVVILGVLGGVGWAGYRFGFAQGAGLTSGDKIVVRPQFGRGDDFNWNRMPMHNGMRPGFHHQGMMGRGNFGMLGGGFGFFSPLYFLLRLAFYALVIWVAYKLITGWRVSFTSPNAPVSQSTPTDTETKST